MIGCWIRTQENLSAYQTVRGTRFAIILSQESGASPGSGEGSWPFYWDSKGCQNLPKVVEYVGKAVDPPPLKTNGRF